LYLTYLSSVFFPVMVCFWSRHNTVYLSTLLKQNMGIPEMLNYIYGLAVPFAGIFISFAIMGLMQKAPLYIQNIFIKTGKISLEIYATHFYFFSLLFLLAPLELHLKIALTFIGVLSLTVAAQWLLKTNKLTAFIFYGKLKR
ncbi:MAG TPA: hypothetical protein VFK73_10225, partial [Paludibacter sp.]|nr:hypothetical protein [Paludibacter sp.]